MGPTVELVDDFEYRLIAFFFWGVFGEEHADPQVRVGTDLFPDHRVRCFLHAIVQESIGLIRAEN